MIFSEFRSVSGNIGRLWEKLETGINEKTFFNDNLTEEIIFLTWSLAAGGIFVAILIGYLVARRTIIFPMNDFTRVARNISKTGDFSVEDQYSQTRSNEKNLINLLSNNLAAEISEVLKLKLNDI